MKCANTVGIPFKEVGKRLEFLNKELNKHGMAILADSEATIEFGDIKRTVATGMRIDVCLCEKPIVLKEKKNSFLRRFLAKNK